MKIKINKQKQTAFVGAESTNWDKSYGLIIISKTLIRDYDLETETKKQGRTTQRRENCDCGCCSATPLIL